LNTAQFGIYIPIYTYTLAPHVWDIFGLQEVQTQTTAAYCRILSAQTTTFEMSFSGSSDTNHGSLL
jgi:hypothetical protein